MRKAHPFAVSAVIAIVAVAAIAFFSRPAAADDLNVSPVAQGTGIQTCTNPNWQGGAKLSVQCQNLDGGAGQKVYYQPIGCSSGCDAGTGPTSILLDFTVNADPYPVTLRAGATGLAFRSLVSTDPLYCVCANRSP